MSCIDRSEILRILSVHGEFHIHVDAMPVFNLHGMDSTSKFRLPWLSGRSIWTALAQYGVAMKTEP